MIYIIGKCIENYKGFLHHVKTTWTLVHKRLQTGPTLDLRKFCFVLLCTSLPGFTDGNQQTELNQALPNALTVCRRTVGVVIKNWGPRNFYICSVFRRHPELMANIFWMKRDINNRPRTLRSTGLLHCPNISWTLVHKRLKPDLSFYPPSLFCFVLVHRTPRRL